MTPEHLARLLAASRVEATERSGDCPDEHQLAGYVDGTLDVPACVQLDRHLANCDHCLELVALLCRERDAGLVEPDASGDALPARPRTLVERPRRWRLAPQWAAAAALVLAVPLLFQLGRNLDGSVEVQGPAAPSENRSIVPTDIGLQVHSAGPGSAEYPGRLSFRWNEVPGTPYYDVRVVTDEGDVIVQQRVTGTSWQPPAHLDLRSSAEYFVLVEAYPDGDKAVSSRHVPFRTPD
jgi:hypothetical protein